MVEIHPALCLHEKGVRTEGHRELRKIVERYHKHFCQRRNPADLAHCLGATHTVHDHVHYDHVRLEPTNFLDCICSVDCVFASVPSRVDPKNVSDPYTRYFMIVSNEYSGAHCP